MHKIKTNKKLLTHYYENTCDRARGFVMMLASVGRLGGGAADVQVTSLLGVPRCRSAATFIVCLGRKIKNYKL